MEVNEGQRPHRGLCFRERERAEDEQDDGEGGEPLLGGGVLGTRVHLLPEGETVVRARVVGEVEGYAGDVVEDDVGDLVAGTMGVTVGIGREGRSRTSGNTEGGVEGGRAQKVSGATKRAEEAEGDGRRGSRG